MDLINRFAGIRKPEAQSQVVGTDVFAISVLSQLIFETGRFYPYPNRVDDIGCSKFYRYEVAFASPIMFGKANPKQSGSRNAGLLDDWTAQSEKIIEATECVIGNVHKEATILADKIRSVACVA